MANLTNYNCKRPITSSDEQTRTFYVSATVQETDRAKRRSDSFSECKPVFRMVPSIAGSAFAIHTARFYSDESTFVSYLLRLKRVINDVLWTFLFAVSTTFSPEAQWAIWNENPRANITTQGLTLQGFISKRSTHRIGVDEANLQRIVARVSP